MNDLLIYRILREVFLFDYYIFLSYLKIIYNFTKKIGSTWIYYYLTYISCPLSSPTNLRYFRLIIGKSMPIINDIYILSKKMVISKWKITILSWSNNLFLLRINLTRWFYWGIVFIWIKIKSIFIIFMMPISIIVNLFQGFYLTS